MNTTEEVHKSHVDNRKNYILWSPYDNVELFHPDGSVMCYLSNKRAGWYLKHDLAEVIGDKQIQLKFQPQGPGEPPELLEKRNNVCVVSGSPDFLTRHHVIPTQYRKWFARRYKDKNCFDIVLLTRDVHDIYENEAYKLKEQLMRDYINVDTKEMFGDFNLGRTLYNCLNRHFDRIPFQRRVWMEIKFYGIKQKTGFKDDDFKSKSLLDITNYNAQIVKAMGEEKMIVLWKHHFIKHAKPEHLPSWWTANLIKEIKGGNSELSYVDVNDPEIMELLTRYDVL